MFNFSNKPETSMLNQKRKSENRRRKLPSVICPSLPAAAALALIVLLPELVDAAFRVDELLFAGEERVANRANIEPYVLLGRTGLERFAAGAVNGCYLVIGMNILLHERVLLK
jgi:hypothetical protein